MSIDFALDWIWHKLMCEAPAAIITGHGDPAPAQGSPDPVPVIMAAALMGGEFDAHVLAHILDMDIRRLRPCLDLVVAAGIVRQAGSAGNGRFIAADPAALGAALALVPAARRIAFHRRAAECLANGPTAPTWAQAIEIARQFEAALAWDQGFQWWCRAADLASAAGRGDIASTGFERALAICRANPQAVPLEAELVALRMLGPLLAQRDGSGADAVAEIYARGLEIAGQLSINDTSANFDMLWGMNACILVHGRIETARELGKRLLRSAKAANNSSQILLAARLQGLGCLLAGDLAEAMANFKTVVALYDPRCHASLRFRYASDQAAVALAHLAWAEAIAGATDASELSSDAALDHAERLSHPHTSAHVACVLAARAQTLNLRDRAAPLAIAGLNLAQRHGYPYWAAWAEIILGWHAGAHRPASGAADIAAAISAYQRTGATQLLPYAYLLLANLQLGQGDCTAAMRTADVALEVSSAHGVNLFVPELIRAKAQASGCEGGRETLLRLAVATASYHGAWLFEARAASALAKLARTPSRSQLITVTPVASPGDVSYRL